MFNLPFLKLGCLTVTRMCSSTHTPANTWCKTSNPDRHHLTIIISSTSTRTTDIYTEAALDWLYIHWIFINCIIHFIFIIQQHARVQHKVRVLSTSTTRTFTWDISEKKKGRKRKRNGMRDKTINDEGSAGMHMVGSCHTYPDTCIYATVTWEIVHFFFLFSFSSNVDRSMYLSTITKKIKSVQSARLCVGRGPRVVDFSI